jgi:hypothetical protein
MRHVETRSDASVAYDTAADHAVTMGEGFCRLLPEYVAPDSFDKDFRIVPIADPFTVCMDPAAIMPAGNDQKWCLITSMMRRTEFKRLHPRAQAAEWSGSERAHRGWDNKELIRLCEYFRIREISDTLYLIRRSSGESYTRYKADLPHPETLLAAGDRIENERKTGRMRVEWFYLNGLEVVSREVLPGEWIPVFRCLGNQLIIDGAIDRWGMVDPMKDAQRMVNFGEVAKIKRLGLTPQAPWVGAEGQFDGHPEWDNTNNAPHAKLVYKPVTIETAQGPIVLPPPQRQPPAQIEAGFAEFTQQMRSNLLAIAGAPNDPGQDEQGQVVSGVAIKRRNALADKSHVQYYDHQTLMIAHLWRVGLSWIPHYFSEERMQRIIGEDSQPQMVQINKRTVDMDQGISAVKNDLSVGRYDAVMSTGPGYDTKREEGSEALIALLNIAPLAEIVAKIGADLVFRSIDHPYMQELADRLSANTPDGLEKILADMPPRAKSIIQALFREVQQLQQQLQAAQTDAKAGITKAHIGAVVKAHDVEESNKTKRLDTITRADTALKVEEIRAAAKILDTHAQAGHDTRLQREMIQAGERSERANGDAS